MGSKKNKLKHVLSPHHGESTPESTGDGENEELMDDLLAQLDTRDAAARAEAATVIKEIGDNRSTPDSDLSKRTNKERFRDRVARKAAAVVSNFSADDPVADARLKKEADDEEADINKVCKELGLKIHEVNADGHCLFSAIADQLALLGIIPSSQATYASVRQMASNYIWTHPNDFLPFLPSSSGEDGAGSTEDGFMNPKEFEEYCALIRDTGQWGGEPEIVALSKAYNVPIHVVQGGKPSVVPHDPAGDYKGSRIAYISYHRRMYGLGEHYNSLRPH